MIPKKIHYVWVGDAPKPELVKKCIKSWQDHCPDWEIVEWGNAQTKSITNPYMQEALATKKWAFVSDYLRLHALYTQGGFYFDTDLELTSDISEFTQHSFVTGLEQSPTKAQKTPMTAFLGSEPAGKIIADLLKIYDDLRFDNEGTLDTTPNTHRFAKYLKNAFGLSSSEFNSGDKVMELQEHGVIYPSHYFCTPEPNKTNYAIHHFDGSWISPVKRRKILALGPYQIIKYSISDPSIQPIPGKAEKIIFSLSLKGKKNRIFQLLRRT